MTHLSPLKRGTQRFEWPPHPSEPPRSRASMHGRARVQGASAMGGLLLDAAPAAVRGIPASAARQPYPFPLLHRGEPSNIIGMLSHLRLRDHRDGQWQPLPRWRVQRLRVRPFPDPTRTAGAPRNRHRDGEGRLRLLGARRPGPCRPILGSGRVRRGSRHRRTRVTNPLCLPHPQTSSRLVTPPTRCMRWATIWCRSRTAGRRRSSRGETPGAITG